MFYFKATRSKVYNIFDNDSIRQNYYNDTKNRDSCAPNYYIAKAFKKFKRKEWRFYRRGVFKVDTR